MSALVSSYDPDQDDDVEAAACVAGGREQFVRFVRHRGEERWERLHRSRRKVWIDDFTAGLAAYRAAGGRS